MTTKTFSVPKINCEACGKLIKMGLSKLSGIKELSVDTTSKTVKVEFDDKQISIEKIQQVAQSAL